MRALLGVLLPVVAVVVAVWLWLAVLDLAWWMVPLLALGVAWSWGFLTTILRLAFNDLRGWHRAR